MSFDVSDSSARPTFVSLFTGAGGMDLGFIEAGFEPVFANDIDEHAVTTYNRAMKRLADDRTNVSTDHQAICGDLTEIDVDFTKISADYVIGGPPCQGFSVAGRMDPKDPRSRHVWNFMKVVQDVSPRGFVMENVKALAVSQRFKPVISELRNLAAERGYRTELFVLNASHYGVPQARERMFFIGSRDSPPASVAPWTKDNPPTVREALDALAPYGAPGNDRLCTAKVTPAKNPVLRRSPYAGMLFNGQGRPLDLDVPSPTLPASMGGNRTPIIDQQQLETGDKPWVVSYHERLMSGLPVSYTHLTLPTTPYV